MTKIGLKFVKILLACLVCGFFLAQIGITADALFKEMGLDPQQIRGKVDIVVNYTLPLLVTGSMIVVPVWLALTLFRSPGD